MEKARDIDCDGIIFDLEDAVAPQAKALARKHVSAAVALGGYGHRELVVRVNGPGTRWFADDVRCVAQLKVGAILFPKVESEARIDEIAAAVDAAGGGGLAVWIMLETALAIQRVDALAAHPGVSVLVMGTTDLVTQLRGRHDAARRGVDYALQRCVIAARAADREILDGVHLDFRNLDTFRAECEPVSCHASSSASARPTGSVARRVPAGNGRLHCQGAQRGHGPRGARPSGDRHARHCRVVALANMPDIPCGPRLALTRMANSEAPELA